MVSSLWGEVDKVLAVQVNAEVVDVVGVFLLDGAVEAGCYRAHVLAVHSIGREDDVALPVLVNVVVEHITYPVVAFGYLRQLSVIPIIYIKMCVTVAVALPEDTA